MTTQTLTPTEQNERTAAYMRRTTAQLRELARLNGINPANMSKRELASAIVEHSLKAQVERQAFDFSGLVIRCAPEALQH